MIECSVFNAFPAYRAKMVMFFSCRMKVRGDMELQLCVCACMCRLCVTFGCPTLIVERKLKKCAASTSFVHN